MLKDDKKPFAGLMAGVCANYGKDVTREMLSVFWNALQGQPYELVARALNEHVQTSRFMPTIADILEFCRLQNPALQRPGPDEAWAMMPRSEDDSVVWTEEMAKAWSVASALVNPHRVERPDWVAARMAFREAYARACEEARAQGRSVRWQVARGHRKDNLEDVLHEAVRLGYLTPAEARPHLLELEHVRPISQRLLLEGAAQAKEEARASALAAVARLKGLLQAPAPDYDIDAVRAECAARDQARERQGRSDAA
jgi:hypothetical protein